MRAKEQRRPGNGEVGLSDAILNRMREMGRPLSYPDGLIVVRVGSSGLLSLFMQQRSKKGKNNYISRVLCKRIEFFSRYRQVANA